MHMAAARQSVPAVINVCIIKGRSGRAILKGLFVSSTDTCMRKNASDSCQLAQLGFIEAPGVALEHQRYPPLSLGCGLKENASTCYPSSLNVKDPPAGDR